MTRGRRLSLPTTGLPDDTEVLYLLHAPSSDAYKVGHSSVVRGRIRTHYGSNADARFFAAVRTPSAEALEQSVLNHFQEERLRGDHNGLTEWMRGPRVTTWAHQFRQWPSVARAESEIDQSSSAQHLWPWFRGVLEDEVGQQVLVMGTGPYVPPIRDGQRGQTSSMSEDWYTPPLYIEAARDVMGSIDLDPMSCWEANQTVKADRFFSAEVNGLVHVWEGTIWLNPPWGGSGQTATKVKAIRKLIRAYEAGAVKAAVVCLNANAMTTAWFQPLLAFPVCVPNHRVKHYGPGGKGGAPNSGTVFIYLGPDEDKFAAVFSRFGAVLCPLSLASSQAFAEDWSEE